MIVYDCEIIKCIPVGTILSNYEYCGGWRDFNNMGISVIGFYFDSKSKTEYLPTPPGYAFSLGEFDNFKEEIKSNEDGHIIGFNSKSFDDNLCQANGIEIKTTYDLLEEIRVSAFGSPHWEDTPKGHSYSLGAIASANGAAKTGKGELAPQLWQDGKHQEVIDYCVNDVKLTVELLKLGLSGKLINPNNGEYLQLRPL